MKYTRKQAIDFLIQNEISDISTMIANNDYYYLRDIFEFGFTGYITYTKKELERAIAEALEGSDKENEEIEVTE